MVYEAHVLRGWDEMLLLDLHLGGGKMREQADEIRAGAARDEAPLPKKSIY